MRSRTITAILSLILALATAAAIVYAKSGAAGSPTVRASNTATLTVGSATLGRPIPPGFVGLTTEYTGLEAYAGANPAALDPVFEQLIRNLAPSQSPILRIGGDSTDWTWFPIPHMTPPGGIRYSLTKTWLQVASQLAKTLDARLILGINFEADSARLAAAETQGLLGGIGAGHISAFELGNEPELYRSFSWYKLPDGSHVRGRPPTYSYGNFIQDFSNVSRAVPRSTTLAGPSVGAPLWIPLLGQFLSGNRRLGLATLHRYPLKHCSPTAKVTIPEILSAASSTGLAASVAGAVATSHAHGVPLRIDEMSAISCGGVQGVSHSFATGLWSLDALFAMARVGVDGVNIQTAPGSWNELFGVDQVKGAWRAAVYPAYYGLMMFAQAAPPGSSLLRVSGAPSPAVHVWATRGPDGTVRVVLINDSTSGSRVITIRNPTQSATATLQRLQAPSAYATQGETLGGQSFGPETRTGLLAGTSGLTSLKPGATGYAITLPAASAALLTLPPK
ncbi:MAG: glycosyl hydrolase family 79 C-terminal domain-containing protein [Actinomycetota bacterium]|nr:glycosyl hydrolase family 79 C-terminal domain-containing protein [Actinomycetota bacterium]